MTERTPEEWGRVAVSLPGWRWMPGMLGSSGKRIMAAHYGGDGWSIEIGGIWGDPDDEAINPDDPVTAGCLLELLGSGVDTCSCGDGVDVAIVDRGVSGHGKTRGRACIAAAEALGRWPGGEQ